VDNPGAKIAPPEGAVDQMVQAAISTEFEKQGLNMSDADADLIIAYLLITQDNVSTATMSEYFSYQRDAIKISDKAHTKGIMKRDSFETGAIVIDLIDAKTNELIYRNFAKRELRQNVSDEQRVMRIQSAVEETLADFFR
jgi:hypothetical protein